MEDAKLLEKIGFKLNNSCKYCKYIRFARGYCKCIKFNIYPSKSNEYSCIYFESRINKEN